MNLPVVQEGTVEEDLVALILYSVLLFFCLPKKKTSQIKCSTSLNFVQGESDMRKLNDMLWCSQMCKGHFSAFIL